MLVWKYKIPQREGKIVQYLIKLKGGSGIFWVLAPEPRLVKRPNSNLMVINPFDANATTLSPVRMLVYKENILAVIDLGVPARLDIDVFEEDIEMIEDQIKEIYVDIDYNNHIAHFSLPSSPAAAP